MAASAIGGWVAAACITKLVDQVCSYAGDQYEYQRKDTKDKLRSLKKSLLTIQAVVHEAERLQNKNTNMEMWLRSIKDAAHQAEDVLDLFNYRVLEAQAEDIGKVTNNSFASATTASCSSTTTTTSITTSSSSTVKQSVCVLKRLLFSDKDLNELSAVVKVFDEIDSQTFLKLVKLEDRKPEKPLQWRTTTSMPGTGKFYGRVNEEAHLKKLLMQTNEQYNLPYAVISVVGIGGVGKTALVQRVYSHFRAASHFNFAVWLHVSDKFDVERLTREMVQSDNLSIPADLNGVTNLDQVQWKLQDKLNGNRILVVLDDVWNELSSQWENLCKPLQYASKGSKVIVTTRSQNIANINGATEMMHLHGLEDEDYWGYFSQCAFGDANPSDFPQLEKIGRQLAKKLAGSPLAAKSVGGSLKLKLDEDHWRAVHGSHLWQIEQKEDDIIPALRLSYKHLPDHLKQCFVYFALFPKNYQHRGDVLIQMWRAQGFINKETPDETAYRYINDLLQLSFIQKAANLEDHFVVHGLLHDFAESVSNGEHFQIDDFHVSIPINVRHLYVNATNISKVYMSLREFEEMKKNLRSLIICKADAASCEGIHWSNFDKVLEQILQELRSLRVLVLCHPDGILPDNINHLVHLRYLNIQESRGFTNFPESIFKLYHLQGLNLQFHYHDGMKVGLQKGLSRLTQLRYLKAPMELISGIESIGKLTSLQELEEYHVKSDIRHSIHQLKELNELRGTLTIKNLENVICKEESYEAKLIKKQNLNKLSLCWNHLEKGITNTDHEGVFEGLQPNPNLRELHVNSYMGIKSPPWLCKEYLSNIHSIELVSCHQWKTLPPFGSLPFLRILKIRHLKAVENIDAGFYGDAAVVFPSLEELIFEGMTQWKRWSWVDSSQHIFPRLHDIRIKHCKQLMGPLPLPVSLNRIKISVSNWLSENIVSSKSKKTANVNTSFSVQLSLDRIGLLIGCLQTSSLATIQMLDISSYHLVAFNKDQEEWLQQLTSVKELRFTDCPQLTSLPSNIIHLTSLEYLYVEKCPKLESFTHMGFPPSLKKLNVIKCHNNLSQICSRTNISNNTIQQDIDRESKLCNAKKRKRTSSCVRPGKFGQVYARRGHAVQPSTAGAAAGSPGG